MNGDDRQTNGRRRGAALGGSQRVVSQAELMDNARELAQQLVTALRWRLRR